MLTRRRVKLAGPPTLDILLSEIIEIILALACEANSLAYCDARSADEYNDTTFEAFSHTTLLAPIHISRRLRSIALNYSPI